MIPFDANGVFHPRAGNHELKRLAIRGAAVTISASALALVAQIVSTVFLARLLAPADFGLVAMATTFSLLLVSFGFNGFTEAVIQFDEIDQNTVSNLHWINVLAGLVLAIAFAASGSLLARFYHNPLVANVAACLSIGIVASSASVVHLALLKRAILFTGASVNDVIGRCVNTAIAIVLALRGWGYWALVVGIIGQQLSVTIGAWILCPWIPNLPKRTGKTRAMLQFAAKVYGQFGVAYSQQNIDNLLVGWRFNAVALGFYKKAFDLFALTASQLTAPMNNVALATLSRLRHDHERFRHSLRNSLGMVALVGMAISADLSLVGKDAVRLVLGQKWAESGRIFEIFAPGIGAMLLCSTVGWVHLPLGKPGRWLRWSLVALGFTVSLFLLALHWGPAGVAAAWSISYWTLLVPSFWYAGKPIGFGPTDLIAAIWKYTAAALVAGVATAAISHGVLHWDYPDSARQATLFLFVISAIFTVTYFVAVIGFHRGLAPVHQLRSLFKELGPSRKNVASVLPVQDQ